MITKPIMQHYFTYTTPKDSDGIYHEGFNYRHHKNFWCRNHPLEDVYQKLYTLVPAQYEAEDPCGEVIRLVTNAYYDLYNNGAGNRGRWSITPEFKRAIRQTGMNREAILTLEQRLSDVFSYMGRGKNFGCVPDGYERVLMHEMEKLLTDAVYFCGLEHCPELVAKIQAENTEPYAKLEKA